MNAVAKISPNASSVVEQVLVSGDLAKLNPEQRVDYYHRVCDSLGLNPLTKPFEYITLNGKLTLYALRGCTDQLRSIQDVSVDEMAETERDGVYIVTAKVRNAAGRTDIAKGAVNIANLKGEALANAIMKAETKAKRRATLSICGLGWLDETELETIPGVHREAQKASLTPPPAPRTELTDAETRALDRQSERDMRGETDEPHDPETGEIIDAQPETDADRAIAWAKKAIVTVRGFTDPDKFQAWYTVKVKGAIGRLGEYDKGLQNILTEAVIEAEDKLLVTP